MHDKRTEESSLEQSYQTLQPMDPDTARTVLVEAKKILDQLGVIFFLRQGTCPVSYTHLTLPTICSV